MSTNSLADIAVVIITRDAAATLGECLDSFVEFPEVVVFDNGSSDATPDIAAAYPNVRLVRGEFSGFGPTKNAAAATAARDWIFSVDADEVASTGLVRELQTLRLDDPEVVFAVDRHNFFCGKRVRHSGWGHDWLVRVYHRELHGYNDAMVHERVDTARAKRVERLRAPLLHRAVDDIGSFLVKIDRYSSIRAAQATTVHSAALIFLRAGWAFFRTYVLRLGLLDGWRGLIIAWADADGVFFKYMKPLAMRRGHKRATLPRD